MSQLGRHARRVGRVVLQIYREYEPQVQEQAQRLGPSTCAKGCAHCCRLMAISTLAEMLPVAAYLTERADWPARRKQLERSIREYLHDAIAHGVSDDKHSELRAEWFRRQIACPFLRDELCSIYPVRPATCRYHIAVSPPSRCAVTSANREVARLDLRPLEIKVITDGARELGALTGGLLPAMFALACRYIGADFAIDDSLIAGSTLTYEGVRR